MSIAQLSPNSVLTNPVHISPLSQSVQHAATAQATQSAQAAIAKSRTDTVTLSSQALKMNARANGLSDEAREKTSGKSPVKTNGKG